MKKYVSLALALVMVMALIVGCQKPAEPVANDGTVQPPAATADTPAAPTAGTPGEGGTLQLNWRQAGGTDSMIECPWTDMQCLLPYMVFDPLVKMAPDGATVVPALAKSMEVSPDGKTYTFTLVENAKWHDGTPFTANDVLFSFNASLREPTSFFNAAFSGIQGAKDVMEGKATTASGIVADGNKVVITLDAPDNSIVADGFAGFMMLPQHLLKDADPLLLSKDEGFWKKPVGTGIFKLDEISYPSYCTAVKNEEYFGNPAKIGKVAFTSYEVGGIEAYVAALIKGDLHFAYGNDINDIARAQNVTKQNPDAKFSVVPATYQRMLWFNNVGSADKKHNSEVQKQEVRQAINLIVDKEAVAGFYAGQAVALSTCVNPEFPAYNTSIPLFQRDVETAKKMLTDAKFDFSKPLRLLYYYDDATTADIMELLKQNFQEAGIKLEPFLATGDLEAQLYQLKNYDIMYLGSFAADPIIIYRNQLVPDGGTIDGVSGDVKFRQETFGKLLAEYAAATDNAEKKKIGDEIQVKAYQYSMYLPVYGLNKIIMWNQAKLQIDESICEFDLERCRDWKFDAWELR